MQVGVELMSRGGIEPGQPMVLGGNLLNCLEEMVEIDTATNEDVRSLIDKVSFLINLVKSLTTIVSGIPGGQPASTLTSLYPLLLNNLQMLDYGFLDRASNENFGIKALKRKYLVSESRLKLNDPESKEMGNEDASGKFAIISKYHRLD
jgi:hypothetical protein